MDKTKEHKYTFPVDLDKLKYTIEIQVLQNATKFRIVWPGAEDAKLGATYHEIVGVLEIAKTGFILQHREEVLKAGKEQGQDQPPAVNP